MNKYKHNILVADKDETEGKAINNQVRKFNVI